MVLGSSPVAVTSPSDFAPASSKDFLDIQATTECGFTLTHVGDMIRIYNISLKLKFFESFYKKYHIEPRLPKHVPKQQLKLLRVDILQINWKVV